MIAGEGAGGHVTDNARRTVEQKQAADISQGDAADLLEKGADEGIGGKMANHDQSRGHDRHAHPSMSQLLA